MPAVRDKKHNFCTNLNIVCCICEIFLEKPPYLRGVFSAAVPPGGEGYPVLRKAAELHYFKGKADFREFGYGTFSGKAVASTEIFVPEKGTYQLNIASINDSARLIIDGREEGSRIAPPWRWEAELQPGTHTLELEICNNSGNRDRNLGLPAGIIL